MIDSPILVFLLDLNHDRNGSFAHSVYVVSSSVLIRQLVNCEVEIIYPLSLIVGPFYL